jgi:hypothetical protein
MGPLIYLLIFAFGPDGEVLLRRKTHPDWQKGNWNGLGRSLKDKAQWELELVNAFLHEAFGVTNTSEEYNELYYRFRTKYRGKITINYPDADVWVFWLHLDEDDFQAVKKDHDDWDGETNNWFTVDELIDMQNQDGMAFLEPVEGDLVESTWEFVELIRSMDKWWSGDEP